MVIDASSIERKSNREHINALSLAPFILNLLEFGGRSEQEVCFALILVSD